MSNLKNRVLKIEQDKQPSGLVIIALNQGETNEQAYQRYFADNNVKPEQVIFASPLDVNL